MATEISTPPSTTDPSALPERDRARVSRESATAALLPRGEEQAVYRGDWFVARFWFACFVLLWLLLVMEFLFGPGGR